MNEKVTGEELLRMMLILMLQNKNEEVEAALFAEGQIWKMKITIEPVVE